MADVVVGDHKVLGSRPNYMHPMIVKGDFAFYGRGYSLTSHNTFQT